MVVLKASSIEMFALRMHVKPLSPFQFKRRENPLFKYCFTPIGECNTMETIRSWQGPEGECYCCGRELAAVPPGGQVI